MKKQTKIFLWIISLLFIASGMSMYWIILQTNEGSIAKVSVYGQELISFHLNDIDEPFEYLIDNHNGGRNTLLVEHGKIRMLHANCPDKLCIERGSISTSLLPIVCLPNGVSVEIIKDEQASSPEIDTLAE